MAKKARKGYFYEKEEEAVKEYLSTTNIARKNKIFNEVLYPAFTTMIESIIRRYGLHIPNEEFQDTFNDTISFLMSKIEHFDPDKISEKTGKKYKAYSYCGTVCKNYLLHRRMEVTKEMEKIASYDEMMEELNDDERYCEIDTTSHIDFLNELIENTVKGIKEIMNGNYKTPLTDKELIVGNALVDLLENWEDSFLVDGSNKLNKSVVLYMLRENTRLSTKEVRDSMRKYKKAYYIIKEAMLKEL